MAGFSEEDQAALYNIAQSAKTAGKQGLGIGSRPKKARGSCRPPTVLGILGLPAHTSYGASLMWHAMNVGHGRRAQLVIPA